MSKKDKLDKSSQLGWIEYRNAVIQNKNKSQDDFEKYINILASGGIILSLTFLEKIATVINIQCMFLFIVGIVLLVFTLLSNLYSHYKSIQDADLIIIEIDEEKYDEIFKNIDIRNKFINCLNKASIISLIIGTSLILTFVTFNLFEMNNNPKPTQIPNKPSTEEKGRTLPKPSPQIKPSNNPKK